LTPVNTWSVKLLGVLAGLGVLTGFLLSVNENVQALDDELVFQSVHTSGTRSASNPVILLLLVFNVFSFYLAVIMYTIIGWIQECLSGSVMKAFVTVFLIVLLAAVIYSPGRLQVLTWGGNVVFPALLVGWAIGDLFRPGL
jgi:hypothetical protein